MSKKIELTQAPDGSWKQITQGQSNSYVKMKTAFGKNYQCPSCKGWYRGVRLRCKLCGTDIEKWYLKKIIEIKNERNRQASQTNNTSEQIPDRQANKLH